MSVTTKLCKFQTKHYKSVLQTRDVKASRPMWPRGRIIWPRPHSFWPRPWSRLHGIWPHRNWPRGLEYLQCTWHTHTHLMAPFLGPLGWAGIRKVNQSGFYWSKRQWVAMASAGPYASLHLDPYRQPCQHPTAQFFTGRIPFLPPNQ